MLVRSCGRQTEETCRQQKVGVGVGFFAVAIAKEGNDRVFSSVSLSQDPSGIVGGIPVGVVCVFLYICHIKEYFKVLIEKIQICF